MLPVHFSSLQRLMQYWQGLVLEISYTRIGQSLARVCSTREFTTNEQSNLNQWLSVTDFGPTKNPTGPAEPHRTRQNSPHTESFGLARGRSLVNGDLNLLEFDWVILRKQAIAWPTSSDHRWRHILLRSPSLNVGLQFLIFVRKTCTVFLSLTSLHYPFMTVSPANQPNKFSSNSNTEMNL